MPTEHHMPARGLDPVGERHLRPAVRDRLHLHVVGLASAWMLALGCAARMARPGAPNVPEACPLDALCLDPAPQATTADLRAALPVFPGAQGFGTQTRAGRGGRILHVTTLAAEGPGSLREALTAAGPRVVVFDVAGTIWWRNDLLLLNPFITVAGQTAPPPGVTIAGAGIMVETHDVLLQHLRLRPGGRPDGPDPEARDAVSLNGATELQAVRVVVDHCSLSWGVDEVLHMWGPSTRDVTLSNCILSEGLHRSIHPKGAHSKGPLIGPGCRRVALLGNLLAHNSERNPRVACNTSCLLAGNVIYNPGVAAIGVGNYGDAPFHLSVVGNVFLPGPDTTAGLPMLEVFRKIVLGSRLYMADNRVGADLPPPYAAALYRNHSGMQVECAEPPVWVVPFRVPDSATVLAAVLDHAGARPADRDAVDRRVVVEVRCGGGRIIDSQDDAGGWPRLDVVRRAAAVPADPAGDADGDGYTNVEEWLHALAAALDPGRPSPGTKE